MLVRLIRFFKGWIEFSASGKFPERLLNICSRCGIILWNPRPENGGLSASCSLSDYRKLRIVARKARIKAKIVKRHGFPFLTARYKSRIGLAVGAAVGIVLLLVLSNFIWSVSITGTQSVSDTRLLKALAENGVEVGAYKNNLDVKRIKRDILLEIDEIGWLSVNITGSSVSVEVREKVQKPEINKIETPCNIKARCDGVITEINAKSGETLVQKGSGVASGDLLVSGALISKLETVRYVHADAEVFADVISHKELYLPTQYEYYSLTENKADRSRVEFLWLELPYSFSFSSYDNSAYSQSSRNVCVNGVFLPIQLKTETAYELVKSNVELDQALAQKIFDNRILLYEVFEKGDSRTISRNVQLKSNENSYCCKVDYVFNENIAQTVEFSVTE